MERRSEALTQVGIPYFSLHGALGEILNDSDVDISVYREMMQRDETIASALDYLSLGILNFLGEYQNEDQELARFVRMNMENVEETLQNTLLSFIREVLAFGYGVMEKVYEARGGKLILRKLVVLPSDTVRFVVEENRITKVVQVATGRVEIPASKCVVFKKGRGIYGESQLRSVYRLYAFKKALMKFWAVACERYAMPVTYAKATNPESVLEPLKNLWSEGVVVTDPSTEISLLEPKGGLSEAFAEAIEYVNSLIFRGLLLPQTLTARQKYGSYALGEAQMNFFEGILRSFAEQLGNALIDQLIAPTIEMNYGTVQNYGSFVVTKKPAVDEMLKISQMISVLVQAGVVDPVSDNAWVRSLLNLPAPQEEEKEGDDGVWDLLSQSQKRYIEQKTGSGTEQEKL